MPAHRLTTRLAGIFRIDLYLATKAAPGCHSTIAPATKPSRATTSTLRSLRRQGVHLLTRYLLLAVSEFCHDRLHLGAEPNEHQVI